MRRTTGVIFVGLVALLVALAGCSGDDEVDAVEEQIEEIQSEETTSAPSEPASEAAQSRGLPVDDSGENDGTEPMVVLNDLVYEWRTSPQRGLQVELEFINPYDTYERARGYAFVIASYGLSGGSVYGVYPWNAEIGEDGFPIDPTAGTHLLYRRDQNVRGFIPYENSEGFYNILQIIVYSEEGELLFTNRLDLDVTGDPTGAVRPPRTINL